jgi:IPT/TIG domain
MPPPTNPIPNIATLNPSSGIAGTSVQITGNNMLFADAVTFNGQAAVIVSQTSTTMVVIAPVSTSGPVQAFNSVPIGGTTKIFTYTATSPPHISGIAPVIGPAGTVVVISGNSFGASQGFSKVTFNGITASIISWSDTSISATVPPTATTGNVVVTVAGVASNGVLFTVGSPSNGGTQQPLNLFLILGLNFNTAAIWTLDPTNFDDPEIGGFYNWKVEDVIAGRTPTVSRAIISYRDLGVANFTLTLTGTNDSGAVVSASAPVTVGTIGASQRIATVVVGIALTGQNIQPSVSRIPGSGPLSITKLRLEGIVEKTTY